MLPINPNLSTNKRSKPNVHQISEGILNGETMWLAQGITLLESSLEAHRVMAELIIEKCLSNAGNSMRIGITGVPGVGKSTFIESFGLHILNQESSRKLAVLAIDPSSKEGKGSILGDKTRMENLGVHERAFIRPSPAGSTLGGVANHTREVILLCEAAGYNTIFVETVGVGQSETAVQAMTDCFLLLLLPGGGDELQGIKRGIMEMADIIAVNKSDINSSFAEETRHAYANALHLFPLKKNEWIPETILCSALKGEGLAEIWAVIEKYFRHQQIAGLFEKRRTEQQVNWLHENIKEMVLGEFYAQHQELIQNIESKIKSGEISSIEGGRQLKIKN
jgi:LAO/AO transport system kinase